MSIAWIDDVKRGRTDRTILRQKRLILCLIKIELEPDKLSGVPGEVCTLHHPSHQVTGASPWRPAFDKDRQFSLQSLGASFREVVLDEGELTGSDCKGNDLHAGQ